MKGEYDFSKGRRGAIIPTKGKTRITIYIDDSTLEAFRSRAEEAGTGYQTMMNEALKEYLGRVTEPPVTESTLRRILKEEFHQATQPTKAR
ncbi:MAG: BrnA antitoxin family protein [Pseudomonadota bacterium]|nr:BrnA antitoxin family protein [Pseudomonadota bacterium]